MLRAILRQPILGSWLRKVDLDMRIAWCRTMVEGVGGGVSGAMEEERERMVELKSWTLSNFALADAKIEELCN